MKPRPLTERERTLIDLYGYCQLGMTPQQFYAKWHVNCKQPTANPPGIAGAFKKA